MSTDLITIGPVPCEENCAQVGSVDYEDRSRRECLIYQRMLGRVFPLPADVPVRLVVKTFAHELGSYREVCVRYDNDDLRACRYAYRLEAQSPAEWDAIARYELAWLERQEQLRRAVKRGDLQPQEVPEAYRSNDFPALPPECSFSELLATFPL